VQLDVEAVDPLLTELHAERRASHVAVRVLQHVDGRHAGRSTADRANGRVERDSLVAEGLSRHRLLVAREDERVLGYASSSTYRSRAAYAPSVETSVYVDHCSIGRGVGSALLQALLSELETEDVHRACAGIALPNPTSVRLHERFGYRHVGTFTEQGRKFGRYWDVAWFERVFPDRVAEEAS
jgi:L-amino acid N-acyltransferase YncA